MLLAIDIGNTNITLGIFEPRKGKAVKIPKVSQSWRLNTVAKGTADEYGSKILDLLNYASIDRSSIKHVAIASVVPPLTAAFKELTLKIFRFNPYVIGETGRISMPNLYDNPREVGADRIVNAVAAFKRVGGPCIVVDFGTATTFDCVSKKGEYLGGIIVPGPNLAAESLALHTAKLPKVNMVKPDRVIGKTTVGSIQSGLYFGYLALVDGLIQRIKKDLGASCRVLATGGLASLIAPESKHIDVKMIFPDLTLEGICLLQEENLK